ncbi:MAG: hypothetical protein NC548_51670 [Lachnospiraceae bacterium]|nr:hypothetical protein [Lachnospiraceae bacterium]MCM1231662.1 hypothetical protein [Ruminococcus flavefaciens]
MRITDVDIMIKYLDRMQIGYSALVAYGLESNMNEKFILEDIEIMVERCLDVDDIKQTAQFIFSRIKEKNNY